jgi:signal peptidase I
VSQLDPTTGPPVTEPFQTDAGPTEPTESTESGEPAARKRSRTRNTVEWIVVIAIAVIGATLIRTFLFQTYYIPSESMVPTLQVGDRVIVNKLAKHSLNRGDVVVFHRPPTWDGSHPDLIKRVIAFGGETVEIRNDTVYVNGKALVEPYIAENTAMPDFGPFKVPADTIFVMGDNRNVSDDSRYNGAVPDSDIVGRAFFRLWPPGDLGRL